MASEVRTVEEFKKKLTLTKEVRGSRVHLVLLENDRKIAQTRGRSSKEAAVWLIRHMNRMLHEAEALVLEARMLTQEEIDEAVLHDDGRDTASDET